MKPKPSVVQLLRLPGVAKMKAANTVAAGTGWRGGFAGMGSGMGVTHQVGWGARWDAGEGAASVGAQVRELRDGRTLPTERDGRGVKGAMFVGRASGRKII